MKRHWQVQPVMDGARRWDRAYILILVWSTPNSRPALTEAGAPSPPAQEVSHDDGGVGAHFDRAGQAQAQTIEQQLERLRAHVRAQGKDLEAEAIFRDDGVSGATLNRPGPDRLRDAARDWSVERVLVTDPDRLARNYVHLMVLLEELERFDGRVEFLDRSMQQDPQDHLLLQIRGAVAE